MLARDDRNTPVDWVARAAALVPMIEAASDRIEAERRIVPEVIAALPGMTPRLLNAFLDRRESGPVDEQSLPGLLGPSQEGATVDASPAYRVQVRIAFDNGRQVESEAVILTGTTEAPYHVLYWRDDASNGPGQLRTGMGSR